MLNESLFYEIPQNWCVIITDIEHSTEAVESGMHQNVNFIATGSIVALLNVAYKNGLVVPFFSGGDGVIFIVKPSIVDETTMALLKYKHILKAKINQLIH